MQRSSDTNHRDYACEIEGESETGTDTGSFIQYDTFIICGEYHQNDSRPDQRLHTAAVPTGWATATNSLVIHFFQAASVP